MDEQSLSNDLNHIIDEMLGGPRPTGLRPRGLPFDIEPPNQHSSKKEFLEEKALAQTCHDHLNAVIKALVPEEEKPEIEQARSSLRIALEKQAAVTGVRGSPRDITDLIVQNVKDAGILPNSFAVVSQLEQSLAERLSALAIEEEMFWNVGNRAPDYHARAIALRVARIYAAEKGEKPTVGTARDGGHASTAYARL